MFERFGKLSYIDQHEKQCNEHRKRFDNPKQKAHK